MPHHHLNRLLRRAMARLSPEATAQYYLRQIERRGALTEADVRALAAHLPEGPARGPYLRAVRHWAKAHQIVTDLHPEDELDDAAKGLLVRAHVVDRHLAHEAPKHAARESYVEAGGWTNWQQHPWEPSGVLPVPADPEAAWLDFVAWCRDGPYQSAEPLLREETYRRLFTERQPYHAWELRAPPSQGGS